MTPSEAQILTDYDWLYSSVDRYRKLHHAVLPDAELVETRWERVVFACGRQGDAAIPDVSARMGAPRCGRCCDVTGLPRGVGSPKNDPACRAVLFPDETQEHSE